MTRAIVRIYITKNEQTFEEGSNEKIIVKVKSLKKNNYPKICYNRDSDKHDESYMNIVRHDGYKIIKFGNGIKCYVLSDLEYLNSVGNHTLLFRTIRIEIIDYVVKTKLDEKIRRIMDSYLDYYTYEFAGYNNFDKYMKPLYDVCDEWCRRLLNKRRK